MAKQQIVEIDETEEKESLSEVIARLEEAFPDADPAMLMRAAAKLMGLSLSLGRGEDAAEAAAESAVCSLLGVTRGEFIAAKRARGESNRFIVGPAGFPGGK